MKKRNNNITVNTEAAYAVLIGVAMLVVFITFLFVGAIEADKMMMRYTLIRIAMSYLLIGVGGYNLYIK
jgi:hypothetical protein